MQEMDSDLQDDGQLLRGLLVAGAMLQPQLKGGQLLIKKGAGLELHLPLMLQQAARIPAVTYSRAAHLRMPDTWCVGP